MRTILMGTLMAMGIGLVGTSGSTAMPVSGSAILNATADAPRVEQVRYYGHRGYYGRGYGRGYYGHRGYYGGGYYGGCVLGVLC
jgi:hypothetical protein